MVRTRQQEFGTSALVHKTTQGSTQNNQLSTIEEEVQTQQLTHVKLCDLVNGYWDPSSPHEWGAPRDELT